MKSGGKRGKVEYPSMQAPNVIKLIRQGFDFLPDFIIQTGAQPDNHPERCCISMPYTWAEKAKPPWKNTAYAL
jgi:hypothetical protein